jgi:hypothetical protein
MSLADMFVWIFDDYSDDFDLRCFYKTVIGAILS